MKTTVRPLSARLLSTEPWRLAAAVLFVAVLFAGGCARADRESGGAIVVSGNIEVIDAQLAFKIPGRLIERRADEGDHISVDQLIAQLDDAELRQMRDLRAAELAAARSVLDELVAGSRPQEIASAEAALRSAEAELHRAELEAHRQEELRAQDVSALRDLEIARTQRAVAAARVGEATAHLALLREGPRQETIAQARARVAQAQAAVALAETQLSNAQLLAPFSGVVLERHAEPGEFVAAGAPILTAADTSRVWLRAYLDQTDLGRVQLGQAVEVRTDSYPDKTYPGRLTYISDEAEFTPKTVQTTKERVTLVFRIKVDLDNTSGELKPGMAADATIAPAAAR
jgi:HlyD family secretion protein